jgi:hypothetical protein
MSKKNSNDIGNRTRVLPAGGAVPQPTAPTRFPVYTNVSVYNLENNVRVTRFEGVCNFAVFSSLFFIPS